MKEATNMAWWFFFPILFFGGFVLVLIFVALAGWALFSGKAWNRSDPSRIDTAHQTLRERYARGEITKEQFDEMSKVLGQR
ncbi:MAG: SHOCT domain-containing protein [Nitrososphaerota archaeon]|nr:SHOCT domain-containing protein [Nitrososphaerota archaeon]